jgi:hypothetical protein
VEFALKSPGLTWLAVANDFRLFSRAPRTWMAPSRFDSVVFGLHVVDEEHGRRPALLKLRLLVGASRGVGVGFELQLRAVGRFGRRDRQR